MSDGWIKINRKITEMEDYFGEKFSRVQCWIDLLLLAEWKDGRVFYVRGNKVVVNRGEIAISVKQLCDRWGYSNRTVINRLREFEEKGMITIRHTHVINVLTILNYEKYQAVENTQKIEIEDDLQANGYQQNTNVNSEISTIYENEVENTAQQTSQQTSQQTTQPTKNIKNIYVNTSAGVRTREDVFFEELSKSDIWREQMCMKHKISEAELEQWIELFRLDAECRGKTHDNVGDVKRHLNDWLRIQLKIKNNAEDGKESKVQRRGFERSVSKAEDYTTTF